MPRILSGDEISLLVSKVVSVDSGEQKQPAGFDVTVNNIHSFPKSRFTLGIEKGENSSLSQVPIVDGSYFDLELGAYFVELNEITSIPPDAIGILLPRSNASSKRA